MTDTPETETDKARSMRIEEGLMEVVHAYLAEHGARYLGPGRLVDRQLPDTVDAIEDAEILETCANLDPGAIVVLVQWEDRRNLLNDNPEDGDSQGWTAVLAPRRQMQLVSWALSQHGALSLGPPGS